MSRGVRLERPEWLTQEYARRIWTYDPETGVIMRGDRVVGCPNIGRGQLEHRGFRVATTRIIWLMMTGEWPEVSIDHEDTNIKNCAWSNLRLTTHSQNQMNRKIQRNYRSSQYKGVKRRGDKWRAYAIRDRVGYDAGTFASEIDAARVRDELVRQLHGIHGRYNFPLPGEHSVFSSQR